MSKQYAYGKLCSMFYDATKAYAPAAEIDFFIRFIIKNPGRVLEAMSGSGRLQIPLIQNGFIVDGVDNSSIMVDRCRKRCEQLGISAELYEQSLENLNLPHLYNVVTIAVGSFQLITERLKALQALHNLRRHMHKDGVLLLDCFIPDVHQTERSVRIATITHTTKIRLTTRHLFDTEKQLADSFFLYELMINGLVTEQENEFIQVTWYTDEQWYALLQEAGFAIAKIHDVTFRASGPSRVIEAYAQ